MNTHRPAIAGIAFAAALHFAIAPLHAENWPTWRGPNGNSTSNEEAFPLEWSAEKNVRWKVDLPDRGNSSPVVWGNRVFITQAIEAEHRRTLMAFDRRNGELLWQKGTVFKEAEETHQANPYCSTSPVVDGERVIVSHASAGVFCYDLDGNEIWSRDLGPQKHTWGSGSSPLIHGDLCILYHGPGENGHLIGLDKRTGETVWSVRDLPIVTEGRTDGFRGKEPGITGSFSTPILVEAGDRTELVMSFSGELVAFDPATGNRLWWADGLNPLVYTSPLTDGETIVAMGGYYGNSMAVTPGGEGNVTDSHRVWHKVRSKSDIGSGVIKDGHIFLQYGAGIAICMDLKTGDMIWEERLKGQGAAGSSWSSMTLVGDLIYVINQSAEMFILRASPDFEVVAVNGLDGELTNSTQAMSNGELFIRTHKHLWCISEHKQVALAR